MPHLDVRPDIAASPWTDVQNDNRTQLGALERIGLLRNGMASGAASVGLLVRLPDGTPVIAETSWILLKSAVRALAASPVAAEEVD